MTEGRSCGENRFEVKRQLINRVKILGGKNVLFKK
jgi:hypothetical protein